MSSRQENCVLFFVKFPEPGVVKSRLAKEIGAEVAVKVYEKFVSDLLGTLRDVEAVVKIQFFPLEAEQQFKRWIGEDYSYVAQKGKDLGERMKNGFEAAFGEGFSKVVVIGSDSPDLPADYLREVFVRLETSDAVVGPSSDGGYYLIGFSRDSFLPEAFEGISWGSDSVLKETIGVLNTYGRKVYLLPEWFDVDTLEDLMSLLKRSRNTAFEESHTIGYLKSVWEQTDEEKC